MQKQAIPQNLVMSSGLDPSLLPCYFARLSPALLFLEYKLFLQNIYMISKGLFYLYMQYDFALRKREFSIVENKW